MQQFLLLSLSVFLLTSKSSFTECFGLGLIIRAANTELVKTYGILDALLNAEKNILVMSYSLKILGVKHASDSCMFDGYLKAGIGVGW